MQKSCNSAETLTLLKLCPGVHIQALTLKADIIHMHMSVCGLTGQAYDKVSTVIPYHGGSTSLSSGAVD